MHENKKAGKSNGFSLFPCYVSKRAQQIHEAQENLHVENLSRRRKRQEEARV